MAFAAVDDRLTREANERNYLAYLTAALSRAKKLPKPEELTVKPGARRRRHQTPEERWRAMSAAAQSQRPH